MSTILSCSHGGDDVGGTGCFLMGSKESNMDPDPDTVGLGGLSASLFD